MSRWDNFPYVGGGKALAKKPLRVQFLVCWGLGACFIVPGIAGGQTWALALGVVWVIVPFVSAARRSRASRQP